MKRVAIVGGGVSGLCAARLLKEQGVEVVVFEKEQQPGGLIRCERIDGSLFHICGGHVFNTKNEQVRDWFWSVFDKEREFTSATRKSAVCLSGDLFIDYPIENHVYQLSEGVQKHFIADMLQQAKIPPLAAENFGDFLRTRFGETLYRLYFEPYNKKIWRRDLKDVPLAWLEGKLPMPSVAEMLLANIGRQAERAFVHSSFFYPKENGSQFIANRLAEGVDVRLNHEVVSMEAENGVVIVNGESFDAAIYCGNLKFLPDVMRHPAIGNFDSSIEALEFHGTTAAFCAVDPIPYSWFYQPSAAHISHRFICTGNFSPTNDAAGRHTCTVEFTDEISKDEIVAQLEAMPFHPKYITHRYSKYTYPIQHMDTREMVRNLKDVLEPMGIYLVGRFAEWEYFNMDAAIASAMATVRRMFLCKP